MKKDEKLVRVAVVCKYKLDFDRWKMEYGVFGEQYYFIYDINNCGGMQFDRLEVYYNMGMIVGAEPLLQLNRLIQQVNARIK